jgi:uncharacterized protein (TIGR00661 family)
VRILYGCNSQGQGHLGKAAVLVPLLVDRGHQVRVVSSGPAPPAHYQFPGHTHVAGLTYAIDQGRASASRTVREWLQSSPQLARSLQIVRRLVQEFEPQLIISDFEPLTASPLIQPRCEVVSLCRQAALLDPAIPTPRAVSPQAKLVRTMLRMFLMGADRRHGYHYEPASFRCVPPIIRPELFLLQPELGEHVLIYNFHFVPQGEPERLIQWAADRRIPVRAYGFESMPRGQAGYVRFQPTSRTQMLLDMASSRGVITTAGLTTAAEAFLLRKPVCVVPLPDQWEQMANAFHLENAGMAKASSSWDYDAVFQAPIPPAEHRLHRWLMTDAGTVLDAVLGDSSARKAAA